MSGSLYEYDTHIPLLFLGSGVPAAAVERDVELSDVAPTLARIMQIPLPDAVTGKVLEEVVK
ncbi:MAG: hypothetical protein ACLUEV_09110 [Alistipes sp.]